MKKTYIAPVAVEYKISTQCVIAASIDVSDETVGVGNAKVKEEQNSGAGIWDLYN